MSIDLNSLTLAEIVELKAQLDRIQIGRQKPTRGVAIPDGSDGWDWRKSNHELAIEHGYSAGRVSQIRSVLGKPKSTKMTRFAYRTAYTWDWAKANSTLAREHSVDIQVVKACRGILGQPEPTVTDHNRMEYPPLKAKQTYEHLDWANKTDIELSREVGLTRERIRQIRAGLGKPKHLWAHAKYQRFCDKAATMEGPLSRSDFPEYADITFRKYCRKFGRQIAKKKGGQEQLYPWELVNWDLPNILIHNIWRIKTRNIVGSRRCNIQAGKPKFHLTSKPHVIRPEFQPMVDAEKAKAEAYFASKSQPLT